MHACGLHDFPGVRGLASIAECYIRKINTLIEGLPVLDAGAFGESRGAGTHS